MRSLSSSRKFSSFFPGCIVNYSYAGLKNSGSLLKADKEKVNAYTIDKISQIVMGSIRSSRVLGGLSIGKSLI